MPDQLAHFWFAKRVYARLSPPLQARIDVNSPAFRAGTFGPDPLFNDLSAFRRSEGFELHKKSGAEVMGRMRAAVRRGMPCAADYAAGFFCHYALDRICHPELIERHERGSEQHVAMETAYDRCLHLRGEAETPRRIELDPAACRAACEMLRFQTPERFRRNVNAYWRLRRLLLITGGSAVAELVGRMNPAWKGIVPEKQPTEAMRSAVNMLDEKLNAAVPIAAEQLERLFAAYDRDADFDPWLKLNFKGEAVR